MKHFWLVSYHLDGVMAGPAIRFQRYAPLFHERGYRMNIVTLFRDPSLPSYEEREYFNVHRIQVVGSFFRQTRFLTKAIQLGLKKGGTRSIIFSFGVTTFQLWLLPRLKATKSKLYFINTMVVNNEFRPANNPIGRVWNIVHSWLYQNLYRNIAGIITSTRALSSAFSIFSVPEKQLHNIYNGVNLERFHRTELEDKQHFRKALDLPLDEVLFLFVGLKTERKGLKPLIEAWRLFQQDQPNASLVLVGHEKPIANTKTFQEWWDKTKKRMDRQRDKIYILPGSKQIEQYFSAADVFVFLSTKEGMPNVVLEAMATGLPMIINEFDGFSEDYGESGVHYKLVQNNEIPVILKHFKTLYQSEDLRWTLGRAAASYSAQKFDVNLSIDKYCELIDKV